MDTNALKRMIDAIPETVRATTLFGYADQVEWLLAEIDRLNETIAWYQGQAGQRIGEAARAGIAGAPASMPQDWNAQLAAMRSAFHVNMLRAYPDKTHAEIAAEIDKTMTTDGCKFCLGAKGGVPGNANLIGDEVICDYCTSLLMKIKDAEKANPTSSIFAAPTPVSGGEPRVTQEMVDHQNSILDQLEKSRERMGALKSKYGIDQDAPVSGIPDLAEPMPLPCSLKARPLLYSESVNDRQVLRDDLWIVTTHIVNRAAASELAAPPSPQAPDTPTGETK